MPFEWSSDYETAVESLTSSWSDEHLSTISDNDLVKDPKPNIDIAKNGFLKYCTELQSKVAQWTNAVSTYYTLTRTNTHIHTLWGLLSDTHDYHPEILSLYLAPPIRILLPGIVDKIKYMYIIRVWYLYMFEINKRKKTTTKITDQSWSGSCSLPE